MGSREAGNPKAVGKLDFNFKVVRQCESCK